MTVVTKDIIDPISLLSDLDETCRNSHKPPDIVPDALPYFEKLGLNWIGFFYQPHKSLQKLGITNYMHAPPEFKQGIAGVSANLALRKCPLEGYLSKGNRVLPISYMAHTGTDVPEAVREYTSTLMKVIGEGLYIPVFGPRRSFAVFFASTDNPEEINQDLLRCMVNKLFYEYIERIFQIAEKDIDLSVRETDVLYLLTSGLSNKEISTKLGISSHTVNGYLKTIFLKLGVNDRVSAALMSFSFGLTD